MAFKNNFCFLFGILHSRLLKINKPYIVQFSITNRCNAKCSYCYVKYYDRSPDDIPTESVFKIIDKLKESGTRRISLVGGEPLIRADIYSIVDYINKKNIECSMTSNGFLVPEKMDVCKKLDLLVLSLDGMEENHDLNRGKDSFKKVMAAIEAGYRNKIPMLTNTVISRHNINDLDFLIEAAKKYNFYLTFTPMTNQITEEGIRKHIENSPSGEEYREVFRKIAAAKKKGAPILYPEKVYDYTANWGDFSKDKIMHKTPDFKHIKCYGGIFSAVIDANGDLYPCSHLVDVIKVKNILHDTFEEAWRYIEKHPCRACFSPCCNNFNLIFDLDFLTLFDLAKNYKGNVFRV